MYALILQDYPSAGLLLYNLCIINFIILSNALACGIACIGLLVDEIEDLASM